MSDKQKIIDQLLDQIDTLQIKQAGFNREIKAIQEQLIQLQREAFLPSESKEQTTQAQKEAIKETHRPIEKIAKKRKRVLPEQFDWEKFVGENLINKIGIAITVLGVAIGAKFSIDHNLINPVTRIILGYVAGIALLGIGLKLKANYKNYSAVLVSGAMAIFYFITFVAYSFYDLFPQLGAFALMLLFTAYTVYTAFTYNQAVIAHIGLVGAYAVPFLLSNNSGNISALFIYMAIINSGILFVALKKYWKSLYNVSFLLTWLIYISWYFTQYESQSHFVIGLSFSSVFFLLFYSVFLVFKWLHNESFKRNDVQALLLNAFIFYGMGYALLSNDLTGKSYLGFFTFLNALIHGGVGYFLSRKKIVDKNILYLIVGIALVFLTIAIPVELEGSWVTLLWSGEAALLFWIGRTKGNATYERLAYPLILLAFVSIFMDWTHVYYTYNPAIPSSKITPLLNISFFTSMLVITAFGFINSIHYRTDFSPHAKIRKNWRNIINYAIPSMFLLISYFAFKYEIETYWDQLFLDSYFTEKEDYEYIEGLKNYDLIHFKNIWILIYTLIFASILSLFNLRYLKNKNLGSLNLVFNGIVLLGFIAIGFSEFTSLQHSYIKPNSNHAAQIGAFHIGIRYLAYGFVAVLVLLSMKFKGVEYMKENNPLGFDVLLHVTLISILSGEWILWMDFINSHQSTKLGLSIIWGAYALGLIIFGIRNQIKHLRVGAIALFSITLIKLFFYDLSHMDTLSKTFVFITLGVLLLVISFLYNKYTSQLSNSKNKTD